MCLIEISMYYIEISTSLFRDLDIVIRDLDLLIYSNSRSRIVFLIYYFFSMSLIRFRRYEGNCTHFVILLYNSKY